jgi:alpha-L-rhamnosidase
MTVEHLRCEYLADPLGIDTPHPRLSWQLASSVRGRKQTAYRVLVARSAEKLMADVGELWDSGRVSSDRSTLVEYAGLPLRSEQRCYWKVQAWDERGRSSGWSPVAFWSMGLLRREDWRAKWIAASKSETAATTASKPKERLTSLPLLRKSFKVEKPIQTAMLYVSSLGLHEVFLNGQRVGDHLLDPVESNYQRRVYYITHDVTSMLTVGENAIGAAIGYGWYRSWASPSPAAKDPPPALLLQMVLTYEDGSRAVVASDESWKRASGPRSVRGGWFYGDYGGEVYDARLEHVGWNQPGFDDSAWKPATAVAFPPCAISAQMVQPNQVIETYRPIAVSNLGSGQYLVDMGRNLTGWFRIKLSEQPGKEVTLQYSSSHHPGDNPLQEIFGQVDRYICGDREREFCSQFNWRTFRYVKISGLSHKPDLDKMVASLVSTNYARTAEFSCSDELLNRLYQVVLHTHRCLTLNAIQVDCPHRERLGYGAEGHPPLDSALYSFDSGAFYTKWARDFQDSQDNKTGYVPNIAPHGGGAGGPAWSAVCVEFPWNVYLFNGDTRILANHYGSMVRWLAYLEAHSQGDLLRGKMLGEGCMGFLADWASPPRKDELSTPCGKLDSGPDHREHHWLSAREKSVFNNCQYYLQVSLVSKIARVLGKESDAKRYAAKAEAIKAAINREYFDPVRGRYTPDDQQQSYLAFSLLLDIVPPDSRRKVMQNLVDDIVITRQGHADFGVLGGYYTLAALVREHRSDLIYRMATQRTCPSWAFMLERGATTLWEYWFPVRSSVHSSYLSIGAWFFNGLAGIQPDPESPGFQRILIKPQIVPGLRWVKSHCDTIRGRVASSWKIEGTQFTLDVTIPANSTGIVFLPTQDLTSIREGGKPVDAAQGVALLRNEVGLAVFQVESGVYHFTSTQKAP